MWKMCPAAAGEQASRERGGGLCGRCAVACRGARWGRGVHVELGAPARPGRPGSSLTQPPSARHSLAGCRRSAMCADMRHSARAAVPYSPVAVRGRCVGRAASVCPRWDTLFMVERVGRRAGRQVASSRRCGPRPARGRTRRRGHAAARARPPRRVHGIAVGDRAGSAAAHRDVRVHLRPHGLRKLYGLSSSAGGARLHVPRDHLAARPRTCRYCLPHRPRRPIPAWLTVTHTPRSARDALHSADLLVVFVSLHYFTLHLHLSTTLLWCVLLIYFLCIFVSFRLRFFYFDAIIKKLFLFSSLSLSKCLYSYRHRYIIRYIIIIFVSSTSRITFTFVVETINMCISIVYIHTLYILFYLSSYAFNWRLS